jgi:hypothetical protein
MSRIFPYFIKHLFFPKIQGEEHMPDLLSPSAGAYALSGFIASEM